MNEQSNKPPQGNPLTNRPIPKPPPMDPPPTSKSGPSVVAADSDHSQSVKSEQTKQKRELQTKNHSLKPPKNQAAESNTGTVPLTLSDASTRNPRKPTTKPTVALDNTQDREEAPPQDSVRRDEPEPSTNVVQTSTRLKDNNIGRPVAIQAPEGDPKDKEFTPPRPAQPSNNSNDDEKIFRNNSIPIPRFWFESGFLLIVVFFAGVVGLVAYSHTLSILADLASLPRVLQYAGYVLLALVLAAVVSGITYFAITYVRLAKHRQIVIQQIRKISDSSRQKDESYRKARTYLSKILEDYPSPELLNKAGIGEKAAEILTKVKSRLQQDRAISSKQWVDEFHSDFQAVLDKIAHERVDYHARQIGIKTAVSPYPLLDMMASLYNSFRLFGDLVLIYNRRMGRIESTYVLAWILISTYVSGEVQEPTEGAIDSFTEQLAKKVPGIAKMVAGKVLEGTANYLLTRRLGNMIINHLQPIQG